MPLDRTMCDLVAVDTAYKMFPFFLVAITWPEIALFFQIPSFKIPSLCMFSYKLDQNFLAVYQVDVRKLTLDLSIVCSVHYIHVK